MPAYYIGSMAFSNGLDILHYGVKGMRWGVRKDDRIRADNQKAFKLGRQATISSRAAIISRRRLDRAKARQSKLDNAATRYRTDRAEKLNQYWEETAKKNEKAVKEHYKELIRKYGRENVTAIKTNKKGLISERTTSGTDIAVSIGATVGVNAALRLLHVPITMIYYPPTAQQRALSAYRDTKRQYDYERKFG